MLSAPGVVIANSSFSYIGDNAVAAWGYTQGLPGNPPLPHGVGIDGRSGEQPRGTRMVGGNRPRDLGWIVACV